MTDASKPIMTTVKQRIASQRIIAGSVVAGVIGVLFIVAIAGDVAATTDPSSVLLQADEGDSLLCDGGERTFLGDAVQTVMQLVVLSAIPVFATLYALDGLLELFAVGADTKAKVKSHERNLWIGAAKIYVAPIVITLAASAIGIGFGNCDISLIPST